MCSYTDTCETPGFLLFIACWFVLYTRVFKLLCVVMHGSGDQTALKAALAQSTVLAVLLHGLFNGTG